MTSDLKCVDDHLNISTRSFRKRKSCTKLYIKFCLKKLPIHFLQLRVPGSLIFMAYPRAHKATLSMRPILLATGTYNCNLAKWLEEKLKPLSINVYTITDAFAFADEIRTNSMNEEDILVSYDVTALFTNVPLDDTTIINILVNKAFTNDWFNKTYDLNLQQDQLARLLEIATTNHLFQSNGQLYQQTDGVVMGSPLGPLMANVFMCHLEEKLTLHATA